MVKRAEEMFIKSAEKGDEVAKGVCAWRGFGGPRWLTSTKLFAFSASPFTASPLQTLYLFSVLFYRKGRGLEQGYAEAVKWYQGYAKALFNLGVCIKYG